jgi:hypothetical protein
MATAENAGMPALIAVDKAFRESYRPSHSVSRGLDFYYRFVAW